MASKTTQSANDFVNYLLRNVPPSWDGATTLYLSAHSGAVGLGGDQQTNEIAYTGYSRIALLRNNVTGEFTVSTTGNSSNQNLLQHGNATGGTFPITISHAAIGENASGAGTVIATGALASSYTFFINTNPQYPTGAVVVLEQ
jgi:hypothetical protein